jgi:hypothetical protein
MLDMSSIPFNRASQPERFGFALERRPIVVANVPAPLAGDERNKIDGEAELVSALERASLRHASKEHEQLLLRVAEGLKSEKTSVSPERCLQPSKCCSRHGREHFHV